MSEDEKHFIEQYRKVNRGRREHMRRFACEDETEARLSPRTRQWVYRMGAASAVWNAGLAVWRWLVSTAK